MLDRWTTPVTAAPVAHAAMPWARRAGALLAQRPEHLAVFLPIPILPTVGSAGDLVAMGALYIVVAALTTVLVGNDHRPDARRGPAVAAVTWLATGLVLGPAAALLLALFIALRTVEQGLPAGAAALRAALATLACVVLVDLALVSLGLERSSLWLALAGAIGLAAAAGRGLRDLAADACPAGLAGAASGNRHRARLETLLFGSCTLTLALYAALLAHEPTLGQLAQTSRFLALPLFAAAVGRLAWLALRTGPVPPDRWALLLVAAWTVASLVLGGS